jgi:uronate dehydrogenase
MKRVLLTGAAGGVGTMIRPLLAAAYPEIVLSDIKDVSNLASNETFVRCELTDAAAVEKLCKGIDGIIHLGGFSVEGTWETILQANIIGCYNTYEGARKAGVKRFVFASSNHAVGFYPRVHRIGTDVTARPDSRYGVSKVFGEGLGSLYSDKHGMGVLSLRIGNVGYEPLDRRRLSIWLHPEDLVQLCRIGLEHPDIRYEVMYGVSLNDRTWFDNTNAYKFGYRPKWRGEDFVEHAMAEQAKLPDDPVGDFYQGGTYCSAEFDGDASKVWKIT